MTAAVWVQAVAIGLQLLAQGAQITLIWKMLDKMVNGAWLLEQARKWGFYFDKILIEYSNKIYNYFVQILNGTILTPDVIKGLMTRLYVFVGLMIFFKLTMIAIKYISNPETFSDDKVGAGSLVKRIIMGAAVITVLPFIFSVATRLQASIIEDNVLARVILPSDVYKELSRETAPGRKIAMTVFAGFFDWNKAIPPTSAAGAHRTYQKVEKYQDASMMSELEINKKVGDQYVYYYVPIVSTLAIGYLLVMFITYALETALRSFKLAFLQIIAPFVLVNYMIDPAKEETMSKWINTTVSTYILIFIRVMTLWFIAFMAFLLKNGIPVGADGVNSLVNDADPLLKALIVLALFAFLKELPKLLSEMFNLNLQENETVTGLVGQGVGAVKGFALGRVGMGFAKEQFAKTAALGAVGAAGGALGSASSTFGQMKDKGITNKGQLLGGAATSGFGSLGSFGSTIGGSLTHMQSSGMSQTVLAPVSQTATGQVNTQVKGDDLVNMSKGYRPTDNKIVDDKEPADNKIDVDNSKSINLSQSIQNDPKLQSFLNENNNIDLTQLDETNVSPMITHMANVMNQQFENNDVAQTITPELMNNYAGAYIERKEIAANDVSQKDLEVVYQQVYVELENQSINRTAKESGEVAAINHINQNLRSSPEAQSLQSLDNTPREPSLQSREE